MITYPPRKSHCAKGHSLAGNNLASYRLKSGMLCYYCRRCSIAKCKRYWHNSRTSELRKQKARVAALREETFSHYGGSRCACCGETMAEFLTLDHINNDGAAERKQLSGRKDWGGRDFYLILKKSNWPTGYQVLCRNCNWGKHVNGGVCPHQDTEARTLFNVFEPPPGAHREGPRVLPHIP